MSRTLHGRPVQEPEAPEEMGSEEETTEPENTNNEESLKDGDS
tara:strand:- start:531 stop:659 length:129 start_codon:yes stop_codon:yes gene_type:complete